MARATKPDPDAAEPEVVSEPEVPTSDELPPEAATESPQGPAQAVPVEQVAPGMAPIPRRSGGFIPLFAGGVVAAALGFAAGQYGPRLLPLMAPESATGELSERLLAQEGRIADLSSVVAGLGSAAPSAGGNAVLTEEVAGRLDELSARTQALETGLGDMTTQLDEVTARLTALANRPVVAGSPNVAAMNAAADQAAAQLKAAEEAAAKLQSETEAAIRQASARTAMAEVHAAVESGAPLTAGIEALEAVGIETPAALVDQAQGVPTLASLRDSFAPAARNALAASLPATADDTTWGRVSAFLRSQSGARSLSPRAGDDPDAILSRAEAALRSADLPGAIAELRTLPPEGQEKMAEWIGLAERRQSALEAVSTLQAAQNAEASE